MAGPSRTKVNRYYPYPVAGARRPTTFSPYVPYSNPGFQTVESVTSINHAQYGGRWSGGGPLNLSRDKKEYFPRSLYRVDNLMNGLIRIENPTAAWADLPSYSQPTELQANALGTNAIALTLPTNPAFDLSVNLGELRNDGIPNLPGHTMMEQTRRAKDAGSEYLNVEFGWLPLVSAVRDFSKVVVESDELIRKYQEDANHVIHRQFHWPIERSEKTLVTNFSMTPPNGFFTGGERHQVVEKRQWFEAEYIYYLPTGGSTNDKIRRHASFARKIYGARLTPEVLWNLAPWSWAADWFANTGNIITNVSNIGADGLVLRNGWLMSHTSKITTDFGRHNGQLQKCVRTTEIKRRWAATPYGFGVSFDSLSGTQVAIISALGLSRW